MSRLPKAPPLTAEALDAATRGAQRPGGLTQRNRSSSHGSDHSSSHSSHSSHQERQRAQHLGEAGGPPSVVPPIASALFILLFLFAGQAIALWLFTRGFLLTRTTLDGTSTCSRPATNSWTLPVPPILAQHGVESMGKDDLNKWQEALLRDAECTLPPVYNRTLLWIIDALRYDFIADTQKRNMMTSDSKDQDWQPNSHYHGILDLPATLDARQDTRFSFLAHFLADAPTTTLQRLKGLTTGSLPTFIDAGSNFGGAEITEDNWLSQLRAASSARGLTMEKAHMGMAGDDTWLTVFPNVFDETWRFPFDSFNVEDLDGVDRGVEEKLRPFLDKHNASLSDWRLLVAHTLGVDHVGHRLGAAHPRMRSKLTEMNDFLKYVVEKLPSDALFIFMGDHGMDDKGDHGGDGELEVGAGLWIYGKQKRTPKSAEQQEDLTFIIEQSNDFLQSHVDFSMLPSPPFAKHSHRSVAQIDIVPTISLLLGLPIPFNNLGSVIPEAFASTELLVRALRINAIQIRHYLQRYSQVSSDLQPFQDDLLDAWRSALQGDARLALSPSSREQLRQAGKAYMYFNRLALTRAKSVWAKFENVKIALGLALLAMNLIVIVMLKNKAGIDDIEALAIFTIKQTRYPLAAGAIAGLLGKTISTMGVALPLVQTLSFFESVAGGAAFAVHIVLLVSLTRQQKDSKSINVMHNASDWTWIGVLLPVAHASCFSSNSFTVHEDKVVLTLTVAVLLVRAVQGYLNAPTIRFKIRMPIFAVAGAIAVRLSSLSRVCREEQGPDCITTFYGQSQSSLNSPVVIAFAYACALGMPYALQRALQMSRSDAGIAPMFFTWFLRPSLLAGCGYWLIDWLLTSGVLDEQHSNVSMFEWAKVALARFDFALVCVISMALWLFSPLCLEMRREAVPASTVSPALQPSQTPSTRIIVLGFANSFGSSYLLLISIVFALHFIVAQPMGQVTLSAMLLVVVALAELGDQERDVQGLAQAEQAAKNGNALTSAEQQSLPTDMTQTSTLAMLGFGAFFATGHQATFASIQWRTAFVGLRAVQYPFSPLLVVLNSFGPVALMSALCVPLLVLWNLAPKPRAAPPTAANPVDAGGQATQSTPPPSPPLATNVISRRMPTVMHVVQASLSFLLYHTILALATALFAAHFRRHLMLFKIWTPRFMLGAVTLQLSYLGLILGTLAAANVMSKVTVTFGSQF